MNKKFRILAGIGGIILIGFLLVITMAFTGNPISKILANRRADKYIQENYPDLKLKKEDSFYNFKDGNYVVKFSNEESRDIHFNIETDYLGRLRYDGYKEDVLSKWNTRMRLDEEYGKYVELIIRNNLDYDFDMIMAGTFGDEEDEEYTSELEVDMNFDLHNIPFKEYLTLYIYEDNRSWEKLAQVILEVDELMEEKNFNISEYTIVLEEEKDEESRRGESLGVYEFLKEDLDSNDLPKVLEESFIEFNEGFN